jgi:predicted peptidase
VDDLIQPLSTATERLGQHPYSSQETSFDLLLYLPDEYGKDPQVTWPLILFLHGGPNVTSLDWVRTEPIAVQLDGEFKLPFIVASPLHTGEYSHWSQPEVMDELLTLLEELQTLFIINPDQIYLAGFIEGANGVWELGLAHPELFTALAPVGGYIGYPFTVPENICDLKDMPIWAFHSEKDTLVPPNAQQMLVDALKTCGSNTIQFTVLPNAAHNIFFTVFADPNLYTWMLEQSK